MQQGEEKFGPDPDEFQPSQRAISKKAKREAAAAAAAEAAAARVREEELGGVVDPRRPKKQKVTGRGGGEEVAVEKKGKNESKPAVAAPNDDDDADAEDAHDPSAKKIKKSKDKSSLAASPTLAPRSYPDSVSWGGGGGVVLDGRIAAAIDDMASGLQLCSLAYSSQYSRVRHPP
jgi:hypothetical protein